MTSTAFKVVNVPFSTLSTYFFVLIFTIGNLLLPQLCHLTPWGGTVLLPIYFFTLIATYKFGWRVGLLTAVLSPLINHVLFGMPPISVLPFILTKSILLVIIAAIVSQKTHKISLLHLLIVILGYQVIGSVIEMIVLQSFLQGFVDFRIGIPGMLIQLFGGYALLKLLANYGR